MKLSLLKIGYCRHPEAIVLRGGKWSPCEFPAICALIEHPTRGYMLYDTGYSAHFFEETQPFPYRLYRWITPVHLKTNETLIFQLQQRGITAAEIQTIFISHFHADHIAGLRDFPNAQFICLQSGFEAIKTRQGFSALLNAFVPGLLPHDFQARLQFVETTRPISLNTALAPFSYGYDIFSDGSLIAVELPGHASGQMGLILANEQGQTHFLIADACWHSQAYQFNRPPHWLAHLITADKKAYLTTLQQLHRLYQNNSEIAIIPSHCLATFQKFDARLRSARRTLHKSM